MSYMIPTEDITLTDQREFRQAAVNKAIVKACELSIAPLADLRVNGVPYNSLPQAPGEGKPRISPKATLSHPSLTVRQPNNVADFGCGVGGWLTMTVAAAGGVYSVFATAVPAALTPTLAVNQLVVFYNVSIETTPIPVTLLAFREGAGAGTTYAQFDLESLAVKQVTEGYFSEPIVYNPQRVLNIVVTGRVALAAQARVHLGCFIVEPVGPTIS